MDIIFKARLYHRKKWGGIGACSTDGCMYFVVNADILENDFVDGVNVDVRLININESTVEIVTTRNPSHS